MPTKNFTGVCSNGVSYTVDEKGRLHNIVFSGGCNGNLQGVAKLAEGRTTEEVADLLEGTICGFKNTSCPDQFAKALRQG